MPFLLILSLFTSAFAAEQQKFASNFIYAVMPSINAGEVLAVSHGEALSALNRIKISLGEDKIQIENISFFSFNKDYSLVDEYISQKKSLWHYENNELYMPYYERNGKIFTKLSGTAVFKDGKFELKPGVLNFDTIPDTVMIDNTPYAVNSTATIGGETFSAVLCVKIFCGNLVKGNRIVEKLQSETVLAVTDFDINSSVKGLAVATYGNGLWFSADTGKTWTNRMNQAPVGANLGSIRAIPSVLRGGTSSLIAYKVSKSSKITIEVFSYDMKKIRTIVKNAVRPADPVRSTDSEDVWDGKDDAGRPAALGTYYIKVSDNHGNVGWGKVMSVGGN